MGKWILYFGLVTSLPANSIYWSSPTASPTPLGLNTVMSLNDAGIAVGQAGGKAAEVSLAAPGVTWLGIPFPNSIAVDINSSGQIAGTYETANGYLYGFYWSSLSGMIPLGALGGDLSISTAINGAGQIVGQTADASGNLAAFLWSASAGISKIGDGASILATDINDLGVIAYEQNPSPYLNTYGAVGGSSSPSDLSFGGQGSTIAAMNNAGWVVGETSDGEGFLWTPGGITNFGTSFLPQDLNNNGQIIGSYQGRPAVWTESGGFQFLNLDGYSSVSLAHINDNGQIVGDSQAPEPSALVLFLVGAFLMAAGWRRRIRVSARYRGLSRSPAIDPGTPPETCHSIPPVHPR